MLNFNYNIPTRVFFGEGKIEVLGKQIKRYGSRVLLVYGGGSIKKIGVYHEIVKILNDNNLPYFELSNVEPNPKVESVAEGVSICNENNIDFILAIGGGSAIDCAKAIAGSYDYDGDPWDIISRKAKIRKVLPIGVVLTISATGSEMGAGAVITNTATNEKIAIGHTGFFPVFSILDPTYTYSVSKYQTASGVVDIMSHTLEEYFSNVKAAYLQDRLGESLLKTCIKYGKIVLDEPRNYEARANLMWAASLASNGLLAYGKDSIWSIHPLQHELSAHYDVTHGISLGILIPHWMEHVLDEANLYKFVEYGVNVWNIDSNLDDMEIAKMAIRKTSEFFHSLDIPMTLREIGIEEDKLETMAKNIIQYTGGPVGNFKPLEYEDVLSIYRKSF